MLTRNDSVPSFTFLSRLILILVIISHQIWPLWLWLLAIRCFVDPHTMKSTLCSKYFYFVGRTALCMSGGFTNFLGYCCRNNSAGVYIYVSKLTSMYYHLCTVAFTFYILFLFHHDCLLGSKKQENNLEFLLYLLPTVWLLNVILFSLYFTLPCLSNLTFLKCF